MNQANDDPLDKTIDHTGVTDALIEEICDAIRSNLGDDATTDTIRRVTVDIRLPLTYVIGKVREQLGEEAAARVERLAGGEAAPDANPPAPAGPFSALRRLFR